MNYWPKPHMEDFKETPTHYTWREPNAFGGYTFCSINKAALQMIEIPKEIECPKDGSAEQGKA